MTRAKKEAERPFDSQAYLGMELLRFTTAGSVDDGKSTLIGRLLYDSKSIFEDQLEALERASRRRGEDDLNLALLTDGLRAEREQGITIDVAHRYFSTPRRKFIIADCPGHIQYTRNMVTGASTSNLAIILVDARTGVVEQTRRHTFIASLLQIPHIVFCVNKMDLVDWSQQAFEKIQQDFRDFSAKLEVKDIRFIPISALKGDNVVDRSKRMDWYEGPTLLYLLETLYIASDHNRVDCRFPVQHVIRPRSDAHHDYRGYAGRVAGGVFKKGDEILHLPSGLSTRVAGVDFFGREVPAASPPMSVVLRLEDDLDISRGDMLVRPHNQPAVGQELDVMLCWLSERKLDPQGRYLLRHTTREARCQVKDVRYKVDINTLHRAQGDTAIGMNDIARVQLHVTQPLFYDSYQRNRSTGSLILVDEGTFSTVGAGMIVQREP